jgi:hypothetical protein
VPQDGAVMGTRRFQRVPSIWEGSVAAALLAVPQHRLLPRHNIAGIEEGRQTSAGPPTSTQDSDKEQGTIVLARQLIAIEDRCSARCRGAGRGAGNKVPSTYGGNV